MGALGQVPFWIDQPPSFDKLELVSGECTHIVVEKPLKGSPIVLLSVNSEHGRSELRLDTPLWYERFYAFKNGDSIQAWVAVDPFGRNTTWIWQVARKGVIVVGYEERVAEELRSQKALCVFGCVFILLGASLILYAFRLGRNRSDVE